MGSSSNKNPMDGDYIKELLEKLGERMEQLKGGGQSSGHEPLDPDVFWTLPDGRPVFMNSLDYSTNPPTYWVQFPENYADLPAKYHQPGTDEYSLLQDDMHVFLSGDKQTLENDAEKTIVAWSKEDKERILDALEVYEVLLGINIREAPPGVTPALSIANISTDLGQMNTPYGRGFPNYKPDYYPSLYATADNSKADNNGVLSVQTSLLLLDKDRHFVFDDPLLPISDREAFFIYDVMHEFGHVVGMQHHDLQQYGKSFMVRWGMPVSFPKIVPDSDGFVGPVDIENILKLRSYVTDQPVNLGKNKDVYKTHEASKEQARGASTDDYINENSDFGVFTPDQVDKKNIITIIDGFGPNTISNDLGDASFKVLESETLFQKAGMPQSTYSYMMEVGEIRGGNGRQSVLIAELPNYPLAIANDVETVLLSAALLDESPQFTVRVDGRDLIIATGKGNEITLKSFFGIGGGMKNESQRMFGVVDDSGAFLNIPFPKNKKEIAEFEAALNQGGASFDNVIATTGQDVSHSEIAAPIATKMVPMEKKLEI